MPLSPPAQPTTPGDSQKQGPCHSFAHTALLGSSELSPTPGICAVDPALWDRPRGEPPGDQGLTGALPLTVQLCRWASFASQGLAALLQAENLSLALEAPERPGEVRMGVSGVK